MTRKYVLPPLEKRSVYIQSNFDSIAPRYDRFNDVATFGLHRLWKKKAIRAARLRPPFRAVDLCAGTGDLALGLLEIADDSCQIVAVDFSQRMLDILEERLSPEQKKILTTRQADVTALPFLASDSVDAVTIGFGLRNVQNRTAALAEILRMLRPGGRLVILEVGKVQSRLVAPFHAFYFKHVVPRLGYLLEGKRNEMYDYLPASAQVYPSQAGISQELAQAGYADIHCRNFLFGATSLHVACKP